MEKLDRDQTFEGGMTHCSPLRSSTRTNLPRNKSARRCTGSLISGFDATDSRDIKPELVCNWCGPGIYSMPGPRRS